MMGISLKSIYLYWMGYEIGSRAHEGINVMPVSIDIPSQRFCSDIQERDMLRLELALARFNVFFGWLNPV